MNDPRFDLLAKNLVSFSVSLKRGERVLCDMFDVPDEMTVALVRAVRAIGAVPFVQIHHGRVTREMSLGAESGGLAVAARVQLAQMKKMHAYIAFRGGANAMESSDVRSEERRVGKECWYRC